LTLRAFLRGRLKEFIPLRLRVRFGGIFKREKVFLLERTLTDASFNIEVDVEVDIRLVQREDFLRITDRFRKLRIEEIGLAHFLPSTTLLKKRFEMGHICIATDIRGDFVNLLWAAFHEVYAGLLERKMRMSSDLVFLYGFYTVPKHRGLGILPKALGKAFNYLYERGIRKVYACIRHDNFPSLRAVQKVGFRKIGTITYTRIFKLRLYRCEGETEEDHKKLKWMFSF